MFVRGYEAQKLMSLLEGSLSSDLTIYQIRTLALTSYWPQLVAQDLGGWDGDFTVLLSHESDIP